MTLQFKVPNMACSICADKITKAIQAIDAAALVQANPKTKVVEVATQVSEGTVREAIVTAGYTVAN